MPGWDTFYVIVGSAGAALIGIQFIVVTLVAGMQRRPNAASFEAFANPTVLHFTSALIISAMVESPWPSERMLTGIHNSWDSVTHLIITRPYDAKPDHEEGHHRGH